MRIEQKKSELVREKTIRTGLIGAVGLFLMLNFIQSTTIFFLIRYATSHHDVHFLPPKVTGEFILSGKGVSEGYLKDMSHFLTQLRFNVTDSSAVSQFNDLLNYMAPLIYGDIRAQLVKEVEQIKHEHLSSAFYPANYDIDSKHFSVKVSGQMRRFVGSELMSDTKETFLIQYVYESGLLKIKALDKVAS